MTYEMITVPHNPEAEQSVIGGLLLDDDSSERVQRGSGNAQTRVVLQQSSPNSLR